MPAMLQSGAKSWSLQLSYGRNHDLPTGPRSAIEFTRLMSRWGRIDRPRREWSFALTLGHMDVRNDDVVSGLANWNDSIMTLAGEAAYRRYFSVKTRHALFAELGLGLVYFDDLVPELGTHANLVSHLGLGAQLAVREGTAWAIEYRFEHTSNMGRGQTNTGLNGSTVSVGYSAHY